MYKVFQTIFLKIFDIETVINLKDRIIINILKINCFIKTFDLKSEESTTLVCCLQKMHHFSFDMLHKYNILYTIRRLAVPNLIF